MTAINIVWFRQDLRLKDNPALVAAAQNGLVLPIYILDDENSGNWKMGAASRWWLHQSLTELDKSLGHNLWILAGDPRQLLPELAQTHKAEAVYWNRCYEPWRTERDRKIKSTLEAAGTPAKSFNGSLLWEPWQNLKTDGTPYKVFTPFYRNGIAGGVDSHSVISEQAPLKLVDCQQTDDKLAKLDLMPSIPWYAGFTEHFNPGEVGAEDKLQRFIETGISNYKAGRDYPALNNVSRLSPHLHFGEISPHRIWNEAESAAQFDGAAVQAEHFQRELAWREFSYSLLYHFPTLTEDNLNPRFDEFPWHHDDELLQQWQRGETGYPLVDAGMRELWATGYMHNRVRMVVGSFLVKNLLQHWHTGAHWFWDCLLDADLPNNTCSWQWVAGCGADAAPYFRVFNPITQSQKFEAEAYIRRYVPELAKLPDKYIHEPSKAPGVELAAANVELGKNYPQPIVDLKASRERALSAYQTIKA
ncbi:MAG: DNA photolyase family protein [Pseudomonadales bacterium]|nr:DNA photolyase family protein [Pseudomonadales bacterium]